MANASRWNEAQARSLVASLSGEPGALLPILHALQDRFGRIDAAAVALVADALNLSRAEVHGVVSFYHDFRAEPFEGRTLKLCRAESCQAAGCEQIVAHLAHRHGLQPDDGLGKFRVETVYCLGNCALSPAAMLDGEPIGRLNPQILDDIIAAAQAST